MADQGRNKYLLKIPVFLSFHTPTAGRKSKMRAKHECLPRWADQRCSMSNTWTQTHCSDTWMEMWQTQPATGRPLSCLSMFSLPINIRHSSFTNMLKSPDSRHFWASSSTWQLQASENASFWEQLCTHGSEGLMPSSSRKEHSENQGTRILSPAKACFHLTPHLRVGCGADREEQGCYQEESLRNSSLLKKWGVPPLTEIHQWCKVQAMAAGRHGEPRHLIHKRLLWYTKHLVFFSDFISGISFLSFTFALNFFSFTLLNPQAEVFKCTFKMPLIQQHYLWESTLRKYTKQRNV